MLREIYEQPEALAATMARYAPGGVLDANAFAAVAEALRGRQRVVIAASGSSRHAGLAGEIMLEDYAGLAVDVEYSSEYMYRSTHTLHDPGVVVISQSGETADTLAALREAKSRGLSTVAITNNAESSMAREADASLPTVGGQGSGDSGDEELHHATQRALYAVAVPVAARRTHDNPCRCGALRADGTATAVARNPASTPGRSRWRRLPAACAMRARFLYLGRAIHFSIAREGALKLKESAYVQAEGLPAGELKHGPNALVSPEAPLVMLATRDQHRSGFRAALREDAPPDARHAQTGRAHRLHLLGRR